MPRSDKDIRKRERLTIDEARQQGIGEAAEGESLVVPPVTEDDRASFLGVDEPVVPEPLRGEESSEGQEET